MDEFILSNGWLHVPYAGPDTELVEVGLGPTHDDVRWVPAFLDYLDGERVAKAPAMPGTHRDRVWLRHGPVTLMLGRYLT